MELDGDSIKNSGLTKEQIQCKEKVEKIFKDNNWNPNTIHFISVDSDENNDLKAIVNHDEQKFILKNIWVREDFRGTGYTQGLLRSLFKENTFMFVWEPNLSFIKAMVKASLGLYKNVEGMDIWCLIPQMLSDISNGFISRHDYLIKYNGHFYTMGTGLDGRIVVSLSYKDLIKIADNEEYESTLKDCETVIKNTRIIREKCDIGLTVQEYAKNWNISEKIAYDEKMQRSKSFMNKYLEKTRKEYEQSQKDNMRFVDI